MTIPMRRGIAALVGVIAIATIAGCTEPAPAASPSQSAAPPAASSAPPPDAEGTPPDPTCESILSSALVETFAEIGWTTQVDPFVLGDQELDGMLCKWANFEQPNANEVQIYGWARIDAAEAAEATSLLENQGWIREETAEGVLVTEDPDFAMIVDDDGYGMTYLFGDGWVIVADTRQNLVLVNRPE